MKTNMLPSTVTVRTGVGGAAVVAAHGSGAVTVLQRVRLSELCSSNDFENDEFGFPFGGIFLSERELCISEEKTVIDGKKKERDVLGCAGLYRMDTNVHCECDTCMFPAVFFG